ncbi:YjjG family noncanonical pyrimidine nucleotidase [Psychrilyobacter atlanticus]|uniref:YjjG family noncanonical pyrimidine nucleotidase n=1 Tax=Psychrilyobacter atlanticus TaxID=271091 RepID=UPI0003F934BB|nr:YjjG family noncanonical pyrimidine nucleotidase [Psychrilyobacter atlanticus]
MIIIKYEIIIFDADETLFDFKKSEKKAFESTIIDFGIEYEENYHFKVYKEINTAIWKELENGLITQKKLKTERFRRLSKKLNIQFNEVEFAKLFMKHLSQASFLYEESEELVKNLTKNYRLTIITNGLSAVQDNRIKKSVIAEYFEDIVVSEEIGISKPNPQIFQHALNNINYTDKNKVLIVGDSLTSDIQGGINFGIDTCWFNPTMNSNEVGVEPTYVISDLMELKDILKK